MKQRLPQPPYAALTPELAQQNFRHFMNLLNYKLFGKAFRRRNNKLRLQVLASLERGALGERLHYHVIIDRPPHIEPWRFHLSIQFLWYRTRWGYRKIDIQALKTGADVTNWLGYVVKRNACLDGDNQAIDVENLWFDGKR